MFEWLHIKNFQAHADLLIEFGPGPTVICGTSDRGKSSIFRALRWVCTNKPNSDGFIRWGTTLCEVTLCVDGHTITRARGKGVNTYTVDGRELKGFGVNVPQEVSEILGLDAGGLNWQKQIEAHLWFHDQSSTVINEINRLVDLSIIDTATSRMAAEHRTAQTRVTHCAEELTRTKQQYQKLQGVPQKVADWDVVFDAYEQHTKATDAAEVVRGLLTRAQGHKAAVDAHRAQGVALSGVVNLGTAWRNSVADVDAVKQLVNKAKGHALQLAFGPPRDMPVELTEACDEVNRYGAGVKHLKQLVDAARWCCTNYQNHALKLAAATKRAETLQQGAKLCPTCKRPL